MTYPYLCGGCDLSAHLTIPAMSAHWRSHQPEAAHPNRPQETQ